MLTVIIPTRDSERPLVHTLAALVPGATAGLVREVIVADGGSRDDTEQVADIAGCVFLASGGPLENRLNAAARRARGEWLMFLRPGIVPGPMWIDDILAFASQAPDGAAVFARGTPGIGARLSRLFGLRPRPDQGLVLPKPLYLQLGGHHADDGDAEADLLRRLGRPRLTVLRTAVTRANI